MDLKNVLKLEFETYLFTVGSTWLDPFCEAPLLGSYPKSAAIFSGGTSQCLKFLEVSWCRWSVAPFVSLFTRLFWQQLFGDTGTGTTSDGDPTSQNCSSLSWPETLGQKHNISETQTTETAKNILFVWPSNICIVMMAWCLLFCSLDWWISVMRLHFKSFGTILSHPLHPRENVKPKDN